MLGRRANLPLALALSLSGLAAAAAAPAARHARAVLACPPVLATTVVAEKHPGWSIYSNDPLRLTGADIAFVADHEDALLDPDQTQQLSDDNLSVVQIFRLKRHREARHPFLVCHYGVHAQLSRAVPAGADECDVVHHQRFGPEQFEFEAACR